MPLKNVKKKRAFTRITQLIKFDITRKPNPSGFQRRNIYNIFWRNLLVAIGKYRKFLVTLFWLL